MNKVDENSEDRVLDELFRHKLENAEVIPSTSVNGKLMSKLGRKEFMHFIPGRFNIWYSGIIAAVITTIALLFYSHKLLKENEILPVVTDTVKNITQTDDTERYFIPVITEDSKTIISTGNKPPQSSGKHSTTKKSTTGVTDNQVKNYGQETVSLENPEVSNSLLKDGLFKDQVSSGKLQGPTATISSNIIASLTEGCVPFKVSFKPQVESFDSCRWNFGDGGSSVLPSPEWLFDVPGEFKVELHIYRNGSPYTGYLTVLAHPSPDALFEIKPDDPILPQDEIRFMNYSAGGEKYYWTFGDGQTSEMAEPYHSYKKSGKYDVSLVVTSQFGCSDTMKIKNAFGKVQYFIEFPNAFIPNVNGPSGGIYSSTSDQEASVFHPVYSGVAEYQLRIFSRRGILIYESNDPNIGWDGYYRNQLSEPGVYIWKVRGNYINGESFTKMGDLTLIKR